ncbi:MAG: DUF5522 domain-containing protein [Vampirovibrionales bacterium]|nr:DUF5522 domain-containing protein [Vampirovibrionales bacterium]
MAYSTQLLECLEQKPEPSKASYFDERHQAAIEGGLDYYIDKSTGYLVWTELYHIRRGSCCESACRHCPFGFGKD